MTLFRCRRRRRQSTDRRPWRTAGAGLLAGVALVLAPLLPGTPPTPGLAPALAQQQRQGQKVLRISALIAAPYTDRTQSVVGVIGVIGPTRINYARIVPMVDYTARVISRILSQQS